MQVSFRYGDEASARRYPLEVSTDRIWQLTDGLATASITVPPCPTGHILVPSVSLQRQNTGFQCALALNGALWPLQPVPTTPAPGTNPAHARVELPLLTEQPGSGEVSTHIDCFHTERDLPESPAADPARPLQPARALSGDAVHPPSGNRPRDTPGRMRRTRPAAGHQPDARSPAHPRAYLLTDGTRHGPCRQHNPPSNGGQ